MWQNNRMQNYHAEIVKKEHGIGRTRARNGTLLVLSAKKKL